MTFDLSALKAYVGGILATAGPSLSSFLVNIFEKGVGIDLPVSVEQTVLYGITFVLGYVGVYFTSNNLKIVAKEA